MKRSAYQAIAAIVWLIMLAAEIFVIWIILRLNVLPGPMVAAVIIALAVLWGIAGFLLFFVNKKAKRNNALYVRRAIGFVIAAVTVIACGFGAHALWSVHNTIQDVTTDPEVETTTTVSMAIYVRMDDPAQTIADTKGYIYGKVKDFEVENNEAAFASLEKIIGTIPTREYETVTEMVDSLLGGDIGAMVLNQVYVSLLENRKDYELIYDQIRVLEDIEVKENTNDHSGIVIPLHRDDEIPTFDPDEPTPEPTATPEPLYIPTAGKKNVVAESFVMYLGGSDTRGSSLPDRTRNDVNLLMVVNPVKKKILIVTTPRDYYVANPACGGSRDKLTHCGIYGINNSVNAMAGLYGIGISYYAQINFAGLAKLVDSIGGIDVYADVEFTAVNKYHFNKGMNHLNGDQAVYFARERKTLGSGDFDRGRNQMKVLTAVLNKLTSSTTLLNNYSSILNNLSGMFKTSLSYDEITALVKMQISDGASWNIESYATNGIAGWDYTASMPGYKLWVAYADNGSIATAKSKIYETMG